MISSALPNGHITARLFTDPGCPYGYSASPALRVLEWRYREQIEWRLAVVGLGETGNRSSEFGPTPQAGSSIQLRDTYGMPFAVEPKLRQATSSRACRAIISARLHSPGSEWKVLRSLQLLQFNTPLLLDDDEQLRAAISTVAGLDADAVIQAIDSDEVQSIYRLDHAEPRRLAGAGSRSNSPSIIFSQGERSLEAAGLQSVETYDLLIANLHPDLRRTPPPQSPWDAIHLYPSGLTTQEVTAIMSGGSDAPHRSEVERRLVGLVGEGRANRVSMGNDAIWLAV